MKLWERLTSVFKSSADPFRKEAQSQLDAKGFKDVRYLTEPLALKPADAISEPFYKDFAKAAVVLSDPASGGVRPLLVGYTRDGEFKIASLMNLARPDDLDKSTDRITGRHMAHAGRRILEAFAQPQISMA